MLSMAKTEGSGQGTKQGTDMIAILTTCALREGQRGSLRGHGRGQVTEEGGNQKGLRVNR